MAEKTKKKTKTGMQRMMQAIKEAGTEVMTAVAILRCNAVAPSADIGEPSAVFNLAVVGCVGVL